MKLRCSVCRQTFPWNPKNGWPDYCPIEACGVYIGTDGNDEVVMPFIRTAATKATDQVQRDIERGSEVRAGLAAEMAGVPVSEMSDLKITDLRPTTHEGDVAAVPVNNPVSQFMDANPNVAGFRGAAGIEYSGAVQAGPFANSGAKMRTALHQHHASLTGGVAVSDRPARETQQPGYRRRG